MSAGEFHGDRSEGASAGSSGGPRFVRAEDGAADVSVVVVNYNTRHLLEPCIEHLRAASHGLRVQVIFVDNASADGSAALIRERFADCMLIESGGNLGFGRANNLAVPHCTGRHILLLNTDAFVDAPALRASVDCLDADDGAAVVGAKLRGRDGAPQPSCRRFPTPLNMFLLHTGLGRFVPAVAPVDLEWTPEARRECDWVPGCFMLLRGSVVRDLGLFDPRYFMYCEEVDLCRRVRQAGWKVVYLPEASAVHLGGESAKTTGQITAVGRQISALQVESELLYFRKHHGRAGVIAWLALSTLEGMLLWAKAVVRRQSRPSRHAPLSQATAVWRTALLTRWGARATR